MDALRLDVLDAALRVHGVRAHARHRPVREMAGWPSDLKAIASSAMETCSPVVSSMSISRAYWYGSFVMPLAG
mgnify:CR=1 FL=1